MTFHFLDDVFLLYLALETAEGIFQRLAFLQSDFSQLLHPPTGPYWTLIDYQSRVVSGQCFMELVVAMGGVAGTGRSRHCPRVAGATS